MKEKNKAILKFGICFVLLLIAYFPTLQWMIQRWTAPESYYGHGFLIPIISLVIAWQRRKLLQNAKLSNNILGAVIVATCLLVHIVCAALKVSFISGFSLVFALYGLILFSFGKEVSRALIFPVFFLLAMMPLPLVLIGNLIVKLKLFVAQTSVFILNRIGFPSIRDGSTIRMPTSFTIVAAPCSGLRSLISLLTLGLLFSFALKASYFKKALLLITSVPIALVTNVIRITALAIVNDLYGEKFAMGLFHDMTGFLVFGIAFLGLYVVGRTLEDKK